MAFYLAGEGALFGFVVGGLIGVLISLIVPSDSSSEKNPK